METKKLVLTLFILFLAAALLLFARTHDRERTYSATSLSPAPEIYDAPIHPSVFNVRMGDYGDGGSYTLENNNLIYRGYLNGNDITKNITLSEDDLRQLRKDLDDVNIWAWKKYYDDDIPQITGTLAWSIEISYPDKSIVSEGQQGKAKNFDDLVDILHKLQASAPVTTSKPAGLQLRM